MLRLSYKKGAAARQRSTLLSVNQKSNLTLAGAVAFLIVFISSGLPDTDYGDDDTDNRHHNTGDLQNHAGHQ